MSALFLKTDDLVKNYILKKTIIKNISKNTLVCKNSYIGRYQNIVVTSLSFWVAICSFVSSYISYALHIDMNSKLSRLALLVAVFEFQ